MNFSEAYIEKCCKAGFNNPLDLEQLFNLFKELHPKDNDYKLISRIRIQMSQAACDSFLQKQDIHTMFLMAYMLSKYKKRWDNRNGVKQWIF